MTIGNHTLPTDILSTCTDGMIWCFSDWAYDVTGGLFWTFMLLAFCIALFIATARFGNVRAFGFAAFVGMLGSIWFAIAQLMPWWIASAFILIGVVSAAVMMLSGE